jgi:hypothetical protein
MAWRNQSFSTTESTGETESKSFAANTTVSVIDPEV